MARTGRYNEWGKTRKQFSYAFLEAGRRLTKVGVSAFSLVAEDFLAKADASWPHRVSTIRNGAKGATYQSYGGDAMHPWYTGQLHDSVAVRIAYKNQTMSVRYMPQSATAPQHTSSEDGIAMSNIYGHIEAQKAAEDARYYFLPGVQIQLIIGVPYAEKVDNSSRHQGFASSLMDDLVTEVDEFMNSGSLWGSRKGGYRLPQLIR